MLGKVLLLLFILAPWRQDQAHRKTEQSSLQHFQHWPSLAIARLIPAVNSTNATDTVWKVYDTARRLQESKLIQYHSNPQVNQASSGRVPFSYAESSVEGPLINEGRLCVSNEDCDPRLACLEPITIAPLAETSFVGSFLPRISGLLRTKLGLNNINRGKICLKPLREPGAIFFPSLNGHASLSRMENNRGQSNLTRANFLSSDLQSPKIVSAIGDQKAAGEVSPRQRMAEQSRVVRSISPALLGQRRPAEGWLMSAPATRQQYSILCKDYHQHLPLGSEIYIATGGTVNDIFSIVMPTDSSYKSSTTIISTTVRELSTGNQVLGGLNFACDNEGNYSLKFAVDADPSPYLAAALQKHKGYLNVQDSTTKVTAVCSAEIACLHPEVFQELERRLILTRHNSEQAGAMQQEQVAVAAAAAAAAATSRGKQASQAARKASIENPKADQTMKNHTGLTRYSWTGTLKGQADLNQARRPAGDSSSVVMLSTAVPRLTGLWNGSRAAGDIATSQSSSWHREPLSAENGAVSQISQQVSNRLRDTPNGSERLQTTTDSTNREGVTSTGRVTYLPTAGPKVAEPLTSPVAPVTIQCLPFTGRLRTGRSIAIPLENSVYRISMGNVNTQDHRDHLRVKLKHIKAPTAHQIGADASNRGYSTGSVLTYLCDSPGKHHIGVAVSALHQKSGSFDMTVCQLDIDCVANSPPSVECVDPPILLQAPLGSAIDVPFASLGLVQRRSAIEGQKIPSSAFFVAWDTDGDPVSVVLQDTVSKEVIWHLNYQCGSTPQQISRDIEVVVFDSQTSAKRTCTINLACGRIEHGLGGSATTTTTPHSSERSYAPDRLRMTSISPRATVTTITTSSLAPFVATTATVPTYQEHRVSTNSILHTSTAISTSKSTNAAKIEVGPTQVPRTTLNLFTDHNPPSTAGPITYDATSQNSIPFISTEQELPSFSTPPIQEPTQQASPNMAPLTGTSIQAVS